MVTNKGKEDMRKFQMRMSDKALEELEGLKNDLEASTKTDAIKSSLKLTKFLVEEKKSGVKIILEDEKGNKREIIF